MVSYGPGARLVFETYISAMYYGATSPTLNIFLCFQNSYATQATVVVMDVIPGQETSRRTNLRGLVKTVVRSKLTSCLRTHIFADERLEEWVLPTGLPTSSRRLGLQSVGVNNLILNSSF